MNLGLDSDDLNKCVQCGLCIPSCPTFRVTGDEALSPRGRIALMRQIQDNDAPVTPEIVTSMDTCLQCRGCEPACPSAVPYGRLIEQTKESLADSRTITPVWLRVALRGLKHPRLVRSATAALGLAQRVKAVPKRFDPGMMVPLSGPPIEPSGNDVYLFTGCVMDAWQRDIHNSTKRVLEAAGLGVTPTGDSAPCCGALHSHGGLGDQARDLARNTIASLTPHGSRSNTPIVVNSAGCGAALKEYGQLLGTEQAARFSQRVFDISEFLVGYLDQMPSVTPLNLRVAIQDPCHLRHVQKVHGATRSVLEKYVSTLIEIDDDGMCCGAAGAYSVVHPELSNLVRDRKIRSINQLRFDYVASANPGCLLHLAAGGVKTIHPIVLVDQALTAAGT